MWEGGFKQGEQEELKPTSPCKSSDGEFNADGGKQLKQRFATTA